MDLDSLRPLPIYAGPPSALTAVLRAVGIPQLFAPVAPVTACSTCRHRDRCLPGGVSAAAALALSHVVIGGRRLRAGEVLVREADAMRYLYTVRVGTLKSSTILNDGREQVGAFLFAGDMFGFDAIAGRSHHRTVVALEDSEVCSIPCRDLMLLPPQARAELGWRIGELAARELMRDQHLLAMTSLRTVEPRLAAFLLWMAACMQERGFSGTSLELRMTRADLGSYLHVTVESVSRAFTSLAHQGLLEVSRRSVEILSVSGLRALCGTSMPVRTDGGARAPGPAPVPMPA